MAGVKRSAETWASWGLGPLARSPLLSAFLLLLTGEQIKRVKPKRTTSFFGRQLSMGQGSYTVVQPSENPEQS